MVWRSVRCISLAFKEIPKRGNDISVVLDSHCFSSDSALVIYVELNKRHHCFFKVYQEIGCLTVCVACSITASGIGMAADLFIRATGLELHDLTGKPVRVSARVY